MKYLIIILSIFFLSTQAVALVPTGDVLSPEGQILANLSDFGLTGMEVDYGPGSTIMVYDPISETGERMIWLSDVEPTSVTWKVYDPNLHWWYEDTHTPSFKVRGEFQGSDGLMHEWAFADMWEFTVPAFAAKGMWLLSPSYRMADGTISSGAYTYYGVGVTKDDLWASIFSAPWFFYGFRMPSYFWFPGFIVWFPPVFYGFSLVFPNFMGKMVESAKKIREVFPPLPRRKRG